MALPPPPFFPDGMGPANLNSFGPKINTTCAAEELGFGGDAAGTTTDYHRYANDNAIGILDSCVNVGGAVACVTVGIPDRAVTDVTGGAAYVQANPNPAGVQGGIDIATSGAGNLYQDDCGGLLGSGTDGEWDYGSAAALLNVRSGAGVEPGTATSGGDGIDLCLDNAATAHHGGDTTVYVQDVVWGGAIGFTVAADWHRPAGLSDSGVDDNNFPGTRHCGDGAIEPCASPGHAGWVNEVVTYGSLPTTPPHIPPTTGEQINRDLDVIFGCNPLDVVARQDPTAVGTPVNSWTIPSGTLADFGNGGASGWLLVFLANAGASVGYDIDDVTEISTSLAVRETHPTAGWIWTGRPSALTGPWIAPLCGSSTLVGPVGPQRVGDNSTTFARQADLFFVVGALRQITNESVWKADSQTGSNPIHHTHVGSNVHHWHLDQGLDFNTRQYKYSFKTVCPFNGSTESFTGTFYVWN